MHDTSATAVRRLLPPRLRVPSRRAALAQTARAAALYAAGLVAFVALPNVAARAAAALVLGLGLARLFGVGHEAMHLAFTGSRRLDRGIAYVAMLPSLHPFAPVVFGHVNLHHRHTNVQGLDPQWPPMSKAEFDAASPARRALERVYRSLPGLGLYWTIEIVGRGLLLPSGIARCARSTRHFARDRAVVGAYVLAMVGSLGAGAPLLRATPVEAIGLGFVVPLALAHWLIGLTTYFQHTGEAVAWHRRTDSPSFVETQLRGTYRLTASGPLAAVVTGRRSHAAHHADTSLPAVHLQAAQRVLDDAFPGAVPTFHLGLAAMVETTRRCKLYDFERREWTGFDGQPCAVPGSPARG